MEAYHRDKNPAHICHDYLFGNIKIRVIRLIDNLEGFYYTGSTYLLCWY